MILFVYALFLLKTVTFAAPMYGSDTSIEYKIVCPYNGVMTGINYRSTVTVDQIEFICTSSRGIATLGPYGGGDGKISSAHCPANHYISSFYGSITTTLTHLGIRCRHQSDMYSEGSLRGELGEENGTHFDELALSIGARPISVTIHANTVVNAMRVIYSNNSITDQFSYALCTSEWGEEHGARLLGKRYQFTCPNDGVINTLTSKSESYPEARVVSIKFSCTSSLGITWYGPFGNGNSPLKDELAGCEGNHYISHISGTIHSTLNTLSTIDVNCVELGKYVNNLKQDEPSVRGQRFDDREWYDDECHTSGRRRPVTVNIYATKDFVNTIQIRYSNIPVEYHCTQTHIQVVDENIVPEHNGFEVMGFASGSTCSTLQQQIDLDLALSFSNSTESGFGLETFSGKEFSTSTDFLGGISKDAVLLIGGNVVVNTNRDPTTNQLTSISDVTTNGRSTAKGTTITYQGPGAAIVVGYRRRYTIKNQAADVLYHYTCKGGSKAPKPGALDLSNKIFGHVFFEDYQFIFNNTAECTSYPRYCVANIKINNFISHTSMLENAFKKCFVSNDKDKIFFKNITL